MNCPELSKLKGGEDGCDLRVYSILSAAFDVAVRPKMLLDACQFACESLKSASQEDATHLTMRQVMTKSTYLKDPADYDPAGLREELHNIWEQFKEAHLLSSADFISLDHLG